MCVEIERGGEREEEYMVKEEGRGVCVEIERGGERGGSNDPVIEI